MKKLSLILAVFMLLGALAACSAQPVAQENDPATAAPAPAATDSAAPAPEAAPAENATAARDTVTVSTSIVLKNIDPHDFTTFEQNQTNHQMYESLYWLNESTGELEPRLALSHEVSEDGLEYTFHLNDKAKFHNGDSLKSSDVVFSVARAKESASLNSFTSAIANVEAIDDLTVKFTLNKAFAPFLSLFSNVAILSEKMVTEAGDQFGVSAISAGTGPYVIKVYNPDVALELDAFNEYYRGEPSIKHLIIKPMRDTSTGLISFENSELDFYPIPLANWGDIESSGKYNTELKTANHTTDVWINPLNPAFKDRNVRLAIAYAMNKESMNIAAYEGYATIANQIFNPDYVFGSPKTGGVNYSYDPAKAKECLAAAGYTDGVDVGFITVSAGTYMEKIAQVLQSNLADVGIKAEIEALEHSTVINKVLSADYGFTVMGLGCQMDYDFFSQYLHSRNSEYSMTRLAGTDMDYKAIDDLFDQASSEMDRAKREQMYNTLDGLVMDTATWLPVFYKTNAFAWNKELTASTYATYYYVFDWSWNS